MDSTNQAVETPAVAAAVGPGVETPVQPKAPEADPESRLKALQAELEKTRSDRDNYRKAALKAKGKAPAEDSGVDFSDPSQLADFIKHTVAETQISRDYEAKEKALMDYAAQIARENNELRLAMASKTASTAIAGGAGAGSTAASGSEVQTGYFSPEQVAELKKRGMNDEQIKKVAALSQFGAQSSQSR